MRTGVACRRQEFHARNGARQRILSQPLELGNQKNTTATAIIIFIGRPARVGWGERCEPQHKPGWTDVADIHVGVRSLPPKLRAPELRRMGKAATREVRYSWQNSERRAHREDKGDTAPVVMGTAPDGSASTTNVPKGAFAHPTRRPARWMRFTYPPYAYADLVGWNRCALPMREFAVDIGRAPYSTRGIMLDGEYFHSLGSLGTRKIRPPPPLLSLSGAQRG
uniref:Uncharacterized protein n=1 Tax=Candidatus Kentrum sp. DK TaxID=2126562 RepID=A0A450SNA5_9GAMM|nr:MAG: hypothetical protein BECKDK2373B_GA0170837_105110 [Candidatus Kentron sp. DK]